MKRASQLWLVMWEQLFLLADVCGSSDEAFPTAAGGCAAPGGGTNGRNRKMPQRKFNVSGIDSPELCTFPSGMSMHRPPPRPRQMRVTGSTPPGAPWWLVASPFAVISSTTILVLCNLAVLVWPGRRPLTSDLFKSRGLLSSAHVQMRPRRPSITR